MSALPTTTILFLVQVITDVELLRPIVAEARRRPGLRARVVVIGKAFRRTPELRRILAATIPDYEEVDEDEIEAGSAPRLDGVDAVFAATESSAPAHRAAHALALRANRLGLHTYTMQHGYENVGLTWFDAEYPPGSVRFESNAIFTWGPIDRLHPAVATETRVKCVPVGCGRPERGTKLPRPDRRMKLVAVFENLHWSRYSPQFRAAFLADLEATARAHPDVAFVVRPHPRGKWLTRQKEGPRPHAKNLLVAASESNRWTPYDAAALIELADGVITTPSTIAIDAALRGRPTSLVAYGLDLSAYHPLPLLQGREDWSRFVAAAVSPRRTELVTLAERFAGSNVLPGNGAARIVAGIVADVRGVPLEAPAERAHAAAAGAGGWRGILARLRWR
jgi:hypothetical protein